MDSSSTMSRGLTFVTTDEDGLVTGVTDAPEHVVKLPRGGLALMGPFLREATGSMLPALQQASR